MINVLILGTLMLVLTVVVESLVIAAAKSLLPWCGRRVSKMPSLLATTILLSALTLWMLAGLAIALWLWAALLYFLGEFSSLSQAMYFTSVSATTLGYGDYVLSERWQLLSGFLAANGLILFSLTTAFLFEVLRRIDEASTASSGRDDA